MGKKGGIPDRWESYSNMGRQIPGTRFIAFKVPLKDDLLRNLPPSVDTFGPRDLMDHCSSLGLVIDLTNTSRYYDKEVFARQNIQYEKINTAGHVVPDTKVVQQFFRIVEKFSEENENNDKLIGVHCTHGVNRTGYLICRYLIQQLGVPPDQAISDFNSSRGHVQERGNYLQDLRTAPWLASSPPPSNQSKRGSEGGRGAFNNSTEGFTPPYLPHQSRRIAKASKSFTSPQNDYSRLSRSPVEPRRGGSVTPSPKYGWSPYTREKSLQMGEGSSPQSTRGRKRSASPTDDERLAKTESFKSPKFGKVYYEQYYKGQVLPQYDIDFYSRGGGGVGPHRPQPRNLPPVQGDPSRPRKYRGPKPYRTPTKQEELDSQSCKKTPDGKDEKSLFSPPPGTSFEGPIRKHPFSTPNLFSPPQDNEIGRRKSQRFQPY